MKFLYQPIKPWVVSQPFGEDRVCFFSYPNGNKLYKGKKTKEICSDVHGVGWESVYKRMNGHNGLDARCPKWTPCYAAQKGSVLKVSTDVDEGLGVVLKHHVKEQNKPSTWWKTRYWHLIMVSSAIKEGKEVKTGEFLGYCDSTGRSTGHHLHFDLKQLNSNGDVLNRDNGYFGAVDPTKYMYDDFALDVDKLYKIIEKLKLIIESLIRKLRW
ncbi:MAG: M23 family metallopeptidase [Nitrosopumilus sp.]